MIPRSLGLLAVAAGTVACTGMPTAPIAGSQAIVVGGGFEANLSGHDVVWAPYTQSGTPVYLMDLSSGTLDTVVAPGGPTEPYFPSIDGRAVVWSSFTEDSAGQTRARIALGDVEGHPPRYLTSGIPVDQYPKISGSHIVWQEPQPHSPDWNVVVYDSLTGDTSLIAAGAFPPYPAIDGDNVVYERFVGRKDSFPIEAIELFNLATRQTQILSAPANQGNVAISGDGVAWTEETSDSTSDIMYRNLTSGAVTNITKNRGHGDFPSISSNRIVWEDYRNGASDIYMYDLRTGREIQITNAPGDQLRPSISGSWIVWADHGSVPERIMAVRVPGSTSPTP